MGPNVDRQRQGGEQGGAVRLDQFAGDDQRRGGRVAGGQVVNRTGPGGGVAVRESVAIETPEIGGRAQRHETAKVVLGAEAGEVVIAGEDRSLSLVDEALEDMELSASGVKAVQGEEAKPSPAAGKGI